MMYLGETTSIEKKLLFPTPLSCLGDFLIQFSENSSFSVWIKDIENFKHIMSNHVCRKKWGLEKQGLEDLTTREVLARVKDFATLEEELACIETHEQIAIRNNTQTTFSENLLTYEGLVSVQKTILIPVFGSKNRPVALVGIAYDLTPHTDLLYLFGLYQQFYTMHKTAVFYFSGYFKLEKYFITQLTCAELKILLAMTRSTRSRSIAHVVGLSVKTVENYLSILKDKLKPNISLQLVLTVLRNSQQCTPNHATS